MDTKAMKYFIKTFGCQMNEADSEKIAAVLRHQGDKMAKRIDETDVVIINTCSVRQTAEDRVFGLINNLIKKKKKRQKIILTGCMLYHPLAWLKKKLPQVDEFKKTEEFIRNLRFAPPQSKTKTRALVPIMEGCDHFCSYCVVPYARGREKSRPIEEIICEVEELVKRDYKEITLLGQNVNSYGKDFPPKEKNRLLDMYNKLVYYTPPTIFALLLRRLHQIEGIEKFSFITSNPWDLTSDIIEAMKLPKIDRYLHLPVQSGDEETLRRMNRPCTAQDYLNLVKKIRQNIPDIKIGTDIIVGFPGETKEQFQNTVRLCQKVGFEKAYIARYSPRPGTMAYKLKDDIPPEEKKKRWRTLEHLINKPQKLE